MSDRAAVVVIGAGIVGASVAYHLAELGVDDVLVVDKGTVPDNLGSTSHAPGGVVAMSHDRLLSLMSFYSTDLYRRLAPYDDPRRTYNPVGSIEVARTPERMEDLVREHGESLAYGAETHLLDAREVATRVPYLDESVMAGGLYIPDSAIISGVNVTGALLRDAVATGRVRLSADTPIEDIETKDGRVVSVRTPAGRIEAERVVLCTNIWQPPVSGIDLPLPLVAFQHQYVETDDVLEGFDPAQPADEITVPTVRDLDQALYFRHHWNRLGVGSYQHDPLPVAPGDVGATADRPFTPADFEGAWKAARQLVPALERSGGFTRTLNGMFAFTVDGMPLIGETTTAGLWMAVGSWITHAGGVGKATAQLMVSDEAEWDLRQASVDRFPPHALTGNYITTVTNKNYRELYDIKHPLEPPSQPRNVRLSPFAPRLDDLAAHYMPFGGIELAAWFGANEGLVDEYADRIPPRGDWASRHWSPIAGAEHLRCRDVGAIFDLTGLSIIEVTGDQAAQFVDYLCSNQMDVTPGRVVYTTWLTPAGGIQRDLAVARLGPDRFWMFVGEGTRPRDMAWVRRRAGGHDVVVTDISDAYTALGVWGPRAPEAVAAAAGSDPDLGYFCGGWIEIGPVPVLAMRISYVGEAGYELHFPVDQALGVFDRLREVSAGLGLVMAGSTSMNSLRIEKGYRLWGADIHTEHDPYEAGLGWTVKLGKGDFMGASACRELADREPSRRLSCLVLDDGYPLGNEPVLDREEAVGYVTSSAFGYSVGRVVAYAYLPPRLATPGTTVGVLVEGRRHPAQVADEPLWDPAGKRVQ